MPKLKQIKCSVELGQSRTPLKEYGARYSDGVVETFVAVPETNMSFSIHVQSEGYIAPGLAVFVFIDGQYHCNRNKLGLVIPEDWTPRTQYEVDFCMRQKEEKTVSGKFVGREWSFAELSTAKSDKAVNLNPRFLQNLGTIEVVVLRCKSEGEYVATPQQPPSKPAPKSPDAKPAKTSKQPSRAPSAAKSTKAAAAAPEDDFGGLFGIFDGANDEIETTRLRKDPINQHTEEPYAFGGLDGAGDERPSYPAPYGHVIPDPVLKDGRVVARPPSGYTWDSAAGRFLPLSEVGHSHSISHYDKASLAERQKRGMKTEGYRDDRTEAHTPIAGADPKRHGQLDGHEAPLVQVTNQYGWTGRGRDDLQGDKYLGTTGRDRLDQKSKMREQGHAVSESNVQHNLKDKLAARTAPGHQPAAYPQAHPPQQTGLHVHTQPVQQQSFQPVVQGGYNIDPAKSQEVLQEIQGNYLEALRKKEDLLHKVNRFRGGECPQHLLQEFHKLHGEIQYLEKEFNWISTALQQHNAQIQNPNLQAHAINTAAQAVYAAGPAAQNYAHIPLQQPYQAPLQTGFNVPAPQNDWVQTGQGEVGKAKTQVPRGQQVPRSGEPTKAAQCPNNGWGQTGQQQGAWDNQATSGWAQDNDQRKTQSQRGAAHQRGESGWNHPSPQQNVRSNGDWKPSSHLQQGNGGGWNGPQDQKEPSNAGWGSPVSRNEQWTGGNGGWSPSGSQKRSFHADNTWNQSSRSKRDDTYKADGWQISSGGGADNNAGGWDNASSVDKNWGGGTSKPNGDERGRTTSRVNRHAGETFDGQSVQTGVYAKSYWADWRRSSTPHESSDPNTKKKRESTRNAYEYPAPPAPSAPKVKIDGIDHGVQAGKGAKYSHRCHRPNYIDTMAEPYAVFSFKYRSKAALEKILKRDIGNDLDEAVKQAEKDKLMSMPRHTLVEELMKMRIPSGATPKKVAKAASVKAESGWGGQTAASTSGNNAWGDAKPASNSGGDGWNDASGGSNKGGEKWGAATSNHSASKKSKTPSHGQAGGWGAQEVNSGGGNGGWSNNGGATGGNDANGWGTAPAAATGNNNWGTGGVGWDGAAPENHLLNNNGAIGWAAESAVQAGTQNKQQEHPMVDPIPKMPGSHFSLTPVKSDYLPDLDRLNARDRARAPEATKSMDSSVPQHNFGGFATKQETLPEQGRKVVEKPRVSKSNYKSPTVEDAGPGDQIQITLGGGLPMVDFGNLGQTGLATGALPNFGGAAPMQTSWAPFDSTGQAVAGVTGSGDVTAKW